MIEVVNFSWEEVKSVQIYKSKQNNITGVKSIIIRGPSFARKMHGRGPYSYIIIPGYLKELPEIIEILENKVPALIKYI